MKYLFIYAHMDDETLMSYGLMRKLIDEQHDVHLLTLCGISRKEGSLTNDRKNVYFSNMSFLTSYHLCRYCDLSLKQKNVRNQIEKYIKYIQPNGIVTHTLCDNHFEHRLISNEVVNCCRIKGDSHIKFLWYSALPSTVQTYNQYGAFQPNVFINISKYINDKQNALQKYVDIKEIPYDNCDIRSLQACLTSNKLYGFQLGVKYVEAYQQIFMKY